MRKNLSWLFAMVVTGVVAKIASAAAVQLPVVAFGVLVVGALLIVIIACGIYVYMTEWRAK